MLNQKIQDAFNKQLNSELFSSYLYLSMAAYFESQNLKGMARWMQLQAEEEHGHALKFLTFINDRGGRVLLTALEGPRTEWESPLAAFEDAYKHECTVTGQINDLVELAIGEKDHASNVFLQWFITEQVEEESSVQEIRDRLMTAGDNLALLYMVDRDLGQRGAPA